MGLVVVVVRRLKPVLRWPVAGKEGKGWKWMGGMNERHRDEKRRDRLPPHAVSSCLKVGDRTGAA